MQNKKLLFIIAVALLTGCSSKQEKACKGEADVAETVMQARLTYGGFAEATYMLAGDNDELREQLSPIIHDAFEYGRGGTATFEKTKQVFKDKYYQQCMDRPVP
ncbi:hypothetical protein [Acinetobacter bereziniae]|uniref:hypothetical protein n=1 Tax=Acinetobacter bereziniae TaxID=106648 RepID=UPI00300A063C